MKVSSESLNAGISVGHTNVKSLQTRSCSATPHSKSTTIILLTLGRRTARPCGGRGQFSESPWTRSRPCSGDSPLTEVVGEGDVLEKTVDDSSCCERGGGPLYDSDHVGGVKRVEEESRRGVSRSWFERGRDGSCGIKIKRCGRLEALHVRTLTLPSPEISFAATRFSRTTLKLKCAHGDV